MLDLIKEISEHSHLVPAENPNTYRIDITAPAYSFKSIVAHLKNTGYVAAIVARDFFDEKLERTILEFLMVHADLFHPSPLFQIIEGFSCDGYTFDSILIMFPGGHQRYQVESPALHEYTLDIAPIHRCEFSGNETAKEFKLLTDHILDLVDWKRDISPLVWMKYKNVYWKGGSIGKSLALQVALSFFPN